MSSSDQVDTCPLLLAARIQPEPANSVLGNSPYGPIFSYSGGMTTFIIADQRALAVELERNMRAFAERVERNPWTHEYRRVKAEVERTGDDSLFVDFQRRFKQDEADRYRRFKGQC